MRVSLTSYDDAADVITGWASAGESRYVCVATVNNAMEAYDSSRVRQVMNQADLVTPDGMPLVWAMRLLGHSGATRVYGPDLTPAILARAAASGIPVGFYGASPATLDRLQNRFSERFPALRISYLFSPPFRPMTPDEDSELVENINRSGSRILFVGLNSPKQDLWMAAHKGDIRAVMIGVGAAFDFLAGTKRQAPRWIMQIGMEWSFRLMTEPRRLWRRYLKHNPRFVLFFLRQLAAERFFCQRDRHRPKF